MHDKFVNTFLGALQLSDGIDRPGIKRVQLLRTGKFAHPKAQNGEFEITVQMLENMKNNFENNVRRLDKNEIAVDYGHEPQGPASGWIQVIDVEKDDVGGASLFIETDWTEKAENQILAREWRFISADIDFDYKDNETNASLGPTLLGAGLVNRPHIKGMNAIFSEELKTEKPKKEFSMSPEEMMKKIGELEQRLASLESQLKSSESNLQEVEKEKEEVVAEKAALSEDLKKTTAENVQLKEENSKVAKEVRFNEYLKDGKVTPAMKEGFMEMSLELSEKMFKDVKALHLNEAGTGTESTTESNDDKSASDIVDERASELMKNNDKLSLSEAYSQVLSADKELASKYDDSTTQLQA